MSQAGKAGDNLRVQGVQSHSLSQTVSCAGQREDRAVRTVDGVYVPWSLQIQAEQKMWVHQAQLPQGAWMKREDWSWGD